MKKYVCLLALIALAGVAASEAYAGRVAPTWRYKDVVIRTSTDTGDPNDQGFIDSTIVSLGAATTVDTSVAIDLSDMFQTADSLTLIRVAATYTSAAASGESLYVTFDGSANGVAWTVLGLATCGTCAPGGYGAAGTLVPGTTREASKLFNAKGSATGGHVASGSVTIGQNNIYGNFFGYPYLRLRLKQDFAVDNVANSYKIRLWYLSNEANPANQ